MKTVLVNPPSTTYRKPEEHLGLGYLTSYLKQNGHECEIIDGFLGSLKSEDIVNQIYDSECKVVGLSPYIDSVKSAKEIAALIKKLDQI